MIMLRKTHKDIGRTGIKAQRRIHSLPTKERDKLIVKLYANTTLSAEMIANLTKKDIINSNFINKSDLLRYTEKINDDDYVFTGQKNNFTKPLSRQHVHHILRKHVSF